MGHLDTVEARTGSESHHMADVPYGTDDVEAVPSREEEERRLVDQAGTVKTSSERDTCAWEALTNTRFHNMVHVLSHNASRILMVEEELLQCCQKNHVQPKPATGFHSVSILDSSRIPV